jgi:ABC-type nitrate/sulfonate/bicarbonate transport system substrate-binding protein
MEGKPIHKFIELMSHAKLTRLRFPKRNRPLRVGFLPVNDCAPLVLAQELGLFERYDLSAVELLRQKSWTEVRDKIISGDLDAAHAPGTLPLIISAGLDCEPCTCVTGLVLSLQGSSITLSRQLWNRGVRDAASLRETIFKDWGKRTYTFGIVFPYSSQHFLLHNWLSSAGIVPGVEVRIVVVPPAQMFPTLKLGYLDGYCVGEPWTSVAVEAGAGLCVSSSNVLAPLHPEKVLIVREDFARERAAEHERLIAALLEACALCDQPENRRQLAELLAKPEYVNAPKECFLAGLANPLHPELGWLQPLFGSNIFHRYRANDPSTEKADWMAGNLANLIGGNLGASPFQDPALLAKVFRRDIFLAASRRAAGAIKLIQSGAVTFQSLRQPGFWNAVKKIASL